MKNAVSWDIETQFLPHRRNIASPLQSPADQCYLRRMASSRMLRRVALVRTDVSEEISAPVIRVTKIGELGTTLAITNNRSTL
jgi:hypothetical protein